MTVRLRRFVRGYVRVRLSGGSPERFFNLCRAKGIGLWGLSVGNGQYLCFMEQNDFKQLCPLVRKSKVKLAITGKYGLPFFVRKNRRRVPYGAGFLIFLWILFFMSQFIWNVSFTGNRRHTDDALEQYLETINVRCGMPKSKAKLSELEEAIRTRYPDILWVSAHISGTKLEIRIKENEGNLTEAKGREKGWEEEAPRDLVSEKEGTVTRIVVRKGRALVKAGDLVEPGQILVSGAIPVTNDWGETDHWRYVAADADVYLKTQESFCASISGMVTERRYTGNIRRGLRLRLGGLIFCWLRPAYGANEWEVSVIPGQLVWNTDFYLPVWWDLITAREYVRYERRRTNQEAEEEKNRIYFHKIQDFTEKGVPILQNNVTILENDLGWEIRCSFVLEEKAGAEQNIKQEEEQETAGYERN